MDPLNPIPSSDKVSAETDDESAATPATTTATSTSERSDARNILTQPNPPSRSRANFEPNPLDPGYESHPFFNRLHRHLQTHDIYDIWRPTPQEHRGLQENNKIECLPRSTYPTQCEGGASRFPTLFRSAAEEAWYSQPQSGPSESSPFQPPRPTSFASSAEQAWYSAASQMLQNQSTSGGPSSSTASRRPTNFSSAAEQAWYSFSPATRPNESTSGGPSSSTTPLRPTLFASAAEQAWYSAPPARPSELTLSPPSSAQPSSSRPTSFSSAAEHSWYSAPLFQPSGSTSIPSSSLEDPARPTIFSAATEHPWYSFSPDARPSESPFSTPSSAHPAASSRPTSFASAVDATLNAVSTQITRPSRPTTFETSQMSSPSTPLTPSFFTPPSQSPTFNTFQQQQQRMRGNFRSSSSLANSIFPRHLSESRHPSSLPSSPRPPSSRARGRRSRAHRNLPTTPDQTAPRPSTSKKH